MKVAPLGSLVGNQIVQASYDGRPDRIHHLVITLSNDKRVVVTGDIRIEETQLSEEDLKE